MQLTSRFSSGQDSWATYRFLKQYLKFVVDVEDHRRLVLLTGIHEGNRYTWFIMERYVYWVCTKAKDGCKYKELLHYFIFSQNKGSNSALFLQFGMFLMNEGCLERDDIFMVDNCSIHCKGNTVEIYELLFRDDGILLITLSPYHPDFNQTEFVF